MSPPEESTVSWLTMERYALGELGEAERREVERCLANSEDARARLKQIMEDASELPELPAVVPLVKVHTRGERRWARWRTALAAAAVLGLGYVSLREVEQTSERRLTRDHVKGGEFALQLVSESGARDPNTFGQGERFKVLVTSPSGSSEPLRLLVFQAGQRFEPLTPTRIEAGNLVPWPGAFALDGDTPVEVCLTWGARVERAQSAIELGQSAACKALAPR